MRRSACVEYPSAMHYNRKTRFGVLYIKKGAGMKIRTYEKKAHVKNGIARLFFSVLAIALEIAFIVVVFTRLNDYAEGINIATRILAVVLVVCIYAQDRTSSMKTPWIMLILAFPIFGIIMYLLVGLNGHTYKMRQRYDAVDAIVLPMLDQGPGADHVKSSMEELRDKNEQLASISYYLQEKSGFPVYADCPITYYDEAYKGFEAQKEALKKAKHFIFMEYFIIDDGEMWREIVKILLEKAKAGVEVRLLYDGMGSQFTLPFRYKKKLTDQGVKCLVFNPFRPMLSTIQNNRDHRKILVIDGNVAFNGGVNIADEYINRKERFGHWKDTAVMLKGDGVWNFTMMFLQMWEVISGDKTEYNMYRPTVKNVVNNGYVIPYGDSPLDDENVGELVYMDMINNAKDYIYISTPYLVPDNEMLTVLGYAAKSGVDVRIITPEIPDKWYVSVITRSFYRDLETLGVKVYEYKGGFNHAKMFLSDDKSAVVGTINLDYRSLYLHFECATYMYKTSCIKDIKADFDDMFENRCHRITHDDINNRSFWSRFMSVILRTIAPLL